MIFLVIIPALMAIVIFFALANIDKKGLTWVNASFLIIALLGMVGSVWCYVP